ncbi:hypothetical protein DPMN_092256 [Dreissena polymorpha]|uniref:Uncharacterized protein n=2 Tax=Dreissena polymorpha TaxID=45954 RepID=A0A9D4L3A3_DREPO|nr:hypothetical protein DPMN_092256 [Dreissena polymorpha]
MHAETYKHWCFHRYSLISEYDRRPVLCPSLILMNHVALLFKYVYIRCYKKNDQLRIRNFNQKLEKEIENENMKWEKIIADDYHLKRERRTLENIHCKVDSSKEILRRIEEQLQQLRSAHLEMKQQIDEQRRAPEALVFRHEPRL